jgi:recombination protein RecT
MSANDGQGKIITVPAGNGSDVARPTPINNFRDLLEKMKPQIALALPRHVDPSRMLRIVLTTVQRTPKLLDCTRESLLACIVQCAQLGLEPDGLLGHAYLIPFWNNKEKRQECQLIVGYKGLLKLARQSGEVSSICARVVHEKDEFDYEYGLEEKLRHRPSMEDDPGPLQFAYAIFFLKDGSKHFEVMSFREIERIRMRSKAAEYGPWSTDYEEMAKKTVLRRASKMSPASIEDRMAKAIAMDELADAGLPQGLPEPEAPAPAPQPEDKPRELQPERETVDDLAAKAKARREANAPKPAAAPAPAAKPAEPADAISPGPGTASKPAQRTLSIRVEGESEEDRAAREAAAPGPDEFPASPAFRPKGGA